MRSWIGSLSIAVNRLFGGKRSETLCGRVASAYGVDCIFCRVVGWLTESDHCERQLK